MSALPVLRTNRPSVRSANTGPRYVLPIPALSGHPLTQGALVTSASATLQVICHE